jgi:hypothetical protein
MSFLPKAVRTYLNKRRDKNNNAMLSRFIKSAETSATQHETEKKKVDDKILSLQLESLRLQGRAKYAKSLAQQVVGGHPGAPAELNKGTKKGGKS